MDGKSTLSLELIALECNEIVLSRNLESDDLEDRKKILINTATSISDHIGFLFHEGKLQFFGLNGKCCTDNLYTNYVMDMFPISGDLDKNAFNYKQIKGDFFSKTISNFIDNTMGGDNLKAQPFIRFAIDYGTECRSVEPTICNIICLYLWTIPEDINEVLK